MSVGDADSSAQGQYTVQEMFNFLLRSFEESDDVLVIRRVFIDMAGDLAAGVMLSRIVYWHQPSKKDGKTRLRVERDGNLWLSKGRDEWWEECRLTAKQIDRIVKILTDKGLIKSKTYQFDGTPKLHVRLVPEAFLEQYQQCTPEGKVDFTQKVKWSSTKSVSGLAPLADVDLDQKVKSYSTGTTAGNTPTTTTTPTAVVEVAKAPIVNGAEIENLTNELSALGITPRKVAAALATYSPELCRAWLDYLKQHPTLGAGFLRKRVQSGEMPETFTPTATPATIDAAAVAESQTYWQSLTRKQKDTFKHDWETEWKMKYPFDPFTVANPDHLEAWAKELCDPNTRKWLSSVQ